MTHPMHPKTLWNDAREAPYEMLYVAIMLSPLYIFAPIVILYPRASLLTAVRVAGGPEPFAYAVAFGSVGYVFAYMALGEVLFGNVLGAEA